MTNDATEQAALMAPEPPCPGPVLVVDDEPPVLRQLADGLQALGCRVRTATGALEALDVLNSDDAICVVVTDIRMPDADGLWLAREVAARYPDPHAVELVVVTGHATVEDATAALRSGVSDFLRKPFRLRELDAAVRQAAGRAAARRRRAAERLTTERRLRETEQERQALQGRLVAARDLISRVIAADPEQEEAESSAELGAISHALRTPLNALSGSTDLLEPNPGGTAEGLAMLRQSVTATMEAVEALEDLHRIRRHRQAATRRAVPLPPLLAGAIAQLRRQAPRLDASLEEGATQARNALADPGLLAQGIQLALLAMLDWCGGEGRVRVAVADDAMDDGGPAVVITIAAARPGREPVFPAEIAAASPGAIPRTVEGLRFLAARHVARLHGGRITAWEGTGTACLRIVLPAAA